MKLEKFEAEEIWSLRNLKLKKFEVEEIWSRRNFKLKEIEVEEIWSWRNLMLKKFEIEQIWSWTNLKLTFVSYRGFNEVWLSLYNLPCATNVDYTLKLIFSWFFSIT